MGKARAMEGVEVPKESMDALNRTLSSLEQLESHLPQILSLPDPRILSQMPPLERAHSLFSLAKITSTLFSLKLRCKGINPDDHSIKSEFDRLGSYQRKLEHLENMSEGPSSPLNFDEDSVPDFSSAQSQDEIEISRGEGLGMNNLERAGQKRKFPSSEEQYVQTADSKEFVKKEPGEFLNGNIGSNGGPPAVIDISDDDDDDDDNDELFS